MVMIIKMIIIIIKIVVAIIMIIMAIIITVFVALHQSKDDLGSKLSGDINVDFRHVKQGWKHRRIKHAQAGSGHP